MVKAHNKSKFKFDYSKGDLILTYVNKLNSNFGQVNFDINSHYIFNMVLPTFVYFNYIFVISFFRFQFQYFITKYLMFLFNNTIFTTAENCQHQTFCN